MQKPRLSRVSVRVHFERGTLRVKANTSKRYAAGFEASISYSDGRGQAVAPNTGQVTNYTNEATVLRTNAMSGAPSRASSPSTPPNPPRTGHSQMGINDQFSATPELKRLLNAPEQKAAIAAGLRALDKADAEYREVTVACNHPLRQLLPF